MSKLVTGLVLMMFGLVLGLAFNNWPIARDAQFALGDGNGPGGLELMSYGIGLAAGMMLWGIGNVPWAALPKQLHNFLVSKMEFYQFVAMGAACVAVLIYF